MHSCIEMCVLIFSLDLLGSWQPCSFMSTKEQTELCAKPGFVPSYISVASQYNEGSKYTKPEVHGATYDKVIMEEELESR